MTQTTRASLTTKLAVAVACLACASLIPAAGAAGAVAVVHYQNESMTTYEQQLAGGQIQAATFNKRIRSLHLTLKDGRHVLVKYPPHQEPKLATALRAKGVPVTVLKATEAIKEVVVKKAVHHKLRYIAGGILVVVVIVVGAVLLINRRRKLAAE
jgi:hypothetical protein